MADLCLSIGFVVGLTGLYLLAGLGWTLLVGGAVLFLAGGLASRSRHR